MLFEPVTRPFGYQDYWHVVQGVGITDSGVLAPQHVVDHIGGGLIKGPMWQMIESFPPENFSRGFKQKPWRCPDEGGCGDGRPKNLAFIDSSEITVQGVSLVDSSDWTQLFRRCHNVLEVRQSRGAFRRVRQACESVDVVFL